MILAGRALVSFGLLGNPGHLVLDSDEEEEVDVIDPASDIEEVLECLDREKVVEAVLNSEVAGELAVDAE